MAAAVGMYVPVVLRDRWPNCWVRGPIMEAGWREMG